MGAWCAYDQDDGVWTRGMVRVTFQKDREKAKRACQMDKVKALD